MAWASSVKVVLGSIAFAIFWVLAVFPAVPFLPVGRTAGSLLGGMLMVIFQVITAEQAYAAIDLQILGLLIGTMVVSVYLERVDMFKYLGKLLSWKSRGAKDLICRVCLISAISSAFFTNDTSCVVLTEFVLKIARQHNLPPLPFLLALASSANIGSAATPIGNPQNLVIAVQSKISFGNFLIGILPVMIMGVIVNALLLLCMYWKLLSIEKDGEDVAVEVIAEEEVNSHRFSPATLSHSTSLNSQEWNSKLGVMAVQSTPGMSVPMGHVENLRNRSIPSENEIQGVPSGTLESARNSNASKEAANDVSSQVKEETIPSKRVASLDRLRDVLSVLSLTKRWKKILRKSCVYLLTIGMLIALLLGLNMSWTAITAALALLVLDFRDAKPSLEKVSYCLLVFFCGMFITVEGFNKTGIPRALWDFMEPYSKIDHVSGIAILTVVILVMSNLASDVPTAKMVLASTVKVVLGLIAFAIFWALAVFPAVPFLPVARIAGSLLGGILMVIFQVITTDQAYAAIDLQGEGSRSRANQARDGEGKGSSSGESQGQDRGEGSASGEYHGGDRNAEGSRSSDDEDERERERQRGFRGDIEQGRQESNEEEIDFSTIPETFMTIIGAVTIAVIDFHSNGAISSTVLRLVIAINVFGFLCCLTSMLHRHRKPKAARIFGTIGVAAASLALLLLASIYFSNYYGLIILGLGSLAILVICVWAFRP